MRPTKRERRAKFIGKKSLALTVALVLIMCTTVGGTMAWLMTKTEPVVNTFTYGDINITLEETDTGLDDDEDSKTNSYEMVPGHTIAKDPVVTVVKDSEDSWLFVKLEKSAKFDDYLTYEIADGWNQLKDSNGNAVVGVYYREVSKPETDTEFTVIKDNEVKVKESVTKEMLNALDADGAKNYPTLTITAYAVQRDANMEAIDTAYEAWQLVSKEAAA